MFEPKTLIKEAEEEEQITTTWNSVKELFTEPHLRRAILLSIAALQVLSSFFYLFDIPKFIADTSEHRCFVVFVVVIDVFLGGNRSRPGGGIMEQYSNDTGLRLGYVGRVDVD